MVKITRNGLFLRIDDRLIHGQVVTTWVQYVGAKRIVVVSDHAASQPLVVMLLKSSVPAYIQLDVVTVQQALYTFVADDMANVMVLVENVADALTLCRRYPFIREVNVGGLRYRPAYKSLHRAVYVSDQDIADFQALFEAGVYVTIQIIPTDRKIPIMERLSR